MDLIEKIKEVYADLADESFDGRNGIIIKDDLNGDGAYIAEWNHETLSTPTQAEVPTLRNYRLAVERLALNQVALGREEQTEEVVIGQEWNEETEEMVDVTETRVIVYAIDPVAPTVDVESYDEEGNVTVTTIENPLITKDNEERAEAQSIIDSTPQEVINAYNAL